MSSSIELTREEYVNQKLYRFIEGGRQILNLIPSEQIYKEKHYIDLYNILYNGILSNYLELKLKKLLQIFSTCVDYKDLLDTVLSKFNITLGDVAPRIVITEPDGTVIIDTYKKTLNTYENWKNKAINENHNTRMSIKNAQYFTGGVGFEKKTSSTIDPVYQYSVAIRAGNKYDNYGVIRLSCNI